MGRAMLLVTVLMASLYAGIMTTMQRNILSLPNIISRNMLSKQAESVSDYALRTAVQNSIAYGQMAGDEALMIWNDYYTNFNIQNCKIDSIKYSFVGGTTNSYRAVSYVNGSMMGKTTHYRAEIAFSFPIVALLAMDYCIYLEMNQPAFNPSWQWNEVIDTSDNENDANFSGNVDTRPHGTGVDGWKAASFGEASGGAIDGVIWHEGNETMVVASNFTLMAFAKINKGRTAATLQWLPPDPDDPAVSGLGWGNVRRKPTGAIWLLNNTIYFTATTVDGVTVQVTAPHTPDAKWPHNKDPWHHFALTYNKGQVKGYIDGVLKGTSQNILYPWYKPSAIQNKGFYLGREYYGASQSGDTFHYMYGMMDQAGLVPRTLTDAEIATYVAQVINPATISYIRD
ncbi:MAG: hypothetical protein PHO32_05930 [Candidatus Cloacimonetes bacterium]|nr:hypothetical protein [Candidatus Cloacimonadota bacterium]